MDKNNKITKTKLQDLFIANKNKIYSLIIFILGCIFYISYVVYLYWEIPFSDTMFDFLYLLDKFKTKTLSFNDFRFKYGEHGMLGYDILYLLNSLIFHLSMRFDIIVNTIMVIICGIITSVIYHRIIKIRKGFFYFGYVLVILAMFSPLQGSATGMSIQVRLGVTFAFLALGYSEKIYRNVSQSLKAKTLLYILIILSYFICGTFYTFSWIAAITFVYLIKMVYGKVNNILTPYKNYCIEICLMFLCVLIYFLFYKISIGGKQTGNNSSNNLPIMIINLIKYIIVSMGSITLPFETIADGKINNILLPNSIYVTICTLVAVIIYWKTKMWEKTLLPLIMILYTLVTFSQIYFGRSFHGLYGAYNSWYNVHTKFLLAAIIMIYIYAIEEKVSINFKSLIIIPKIIRNISLCFLLLTFIPCFVGFNFFSKRAPYIKAWTESKIPYLIGEEELTADANGYSELIYPYNKTIQGIELLKKYKLNIFYNDYVDKLRKKIRYNGFYANEDGSQWINGNANIILVNKTARHFSLTGYYPERMPQNNITVTINNNESLTMDMVPGNPFTLELDFENKFDYIKINIKTEKTVIPKNEGWNEDSRELGTIISSWSLDSYYEIDTTIYLGTSYKDYTSENNKYIKSGLSIEDRHSWSNGEITELKFLLENVNKDLIFQADVVAISGETQEVQLYVNNHFVDKITLIKSNLGVINFLIKKEYLLNGLNEFKLVFPKAISPAELGINEDVRKLAVAFKSFVIRSYEEPR